MMSKRTAILTFLIGGPLLWLPGLIVWATIGGQNFHGQDGSALLLSPALGGFLWCLVASVPRGWLYTWIPTVGTALLFHACVRWLGFARGSGLKARAFSMALHFTLAASLSAVVLSACFAVGTFLGLHAQLLDSDPARPSSFGVPVMLLTRVTLLGIASVVGGVLGAALGALGSAGGTTAVDASPPDVLPRELPPSPTLRQIVGTFVIVGPLLYMPLIDVLSRYSIGAGTGALALPSGEMPGLPLLAPVGALLWYGTIFYPPAWLQTWIPTLATAYLFWAALARSPMRPWVAGRGAACRVLTYPATCGALAVAVFALCQELYGLFAHGSTSNPDADGLDGLLRSAEGHTILMAVAILGIVLGGATYVLDRRGNRAR